MGDGPVGVGPRPAGLPTGDHPGLALGTFSPLSARVIVALLPGLVAFDAAVDDRWSSAVIIFQAQGLSVLLFFLALARRRSGPPGQWGR